MGTESRFREEISNDGLFRDDYTTLRRDRNTRGDRMFICVKNCIACVEVRIAKDFEL
jgi:hypothetical protein